MRKKAKPKLPEMIGGLPARITSEWLKQQYACTGQRRKFRKVFPHGMKLTTNNLLKAARKGLPVSWLRSRLYNDPELESRCYRVIKEFLGDRNEKKNYPFSVLNALALAGVLGLE